MGLLLVGERRDAMAGVGVRIGSRVWDELARVV